MKCLLCGWSGCYYYGIVQHINDVCFVHSWKFVLQDVFKTAITSTIKMCVVKVLKKTTNIIIIIIETFNKQTKIKIGTALNILKTFSKVSDDINWNCFPMI